MLARAPNLVPTEVIRQFTNDAPVDVRGLATALGLRVADADLGQNISGKIERGWGNTFRITINSRHSETRRRFTIAHEIGHFVLHRDMIGDGIVDDGLYRSAQSNAIERQANNYAASILMPAPLVGEKWRAGYRTPDDLANAFCVSPAVAEIRIKELRLEPTQFSNMAL
jgi:Zn-dependent peptidase ImmA (M78 family)